MSYLLIHKFYIQYSEWLAQSQAPVVQQPMIPEPSLDFAPELDSNVIPLPANSPVHPEASKEPFLDSSNIPATNDNFPELLAKNLEDHLHMKPIIVVLQPLNQPQSVSAANPATPIIYGPPVYAPETYAKHPDLYAIPTEHRGSEQRELPRTLSASDTIATANDLALDHNSVMTAEDAHHWKYFTNLIIDNRWNQLNRQSQLKPQS